MFSKGSFKQNGQMFLITSKKDISHNMSKFLSECLKANNIEFIYIKTRYNFEVSYKDRVTHRIPISIAV